MRTRFALALVILAGSLVRPAAADVLAIYNAANGNVRIRNDLAGRLTAVLLKSGSPGLAEFPLGDNLPGTPLFLPGATLDAGDQPHAVVYLNYPVGNYNIGNVVTPGTPLSDLSLEFYFPDLRTPPQFGRVIPEPAAATLALASCVAIHFVRRRVLRGSEPIVLAVSCDGAA